MPNDPKSFLSTDGLQTLIANIKASLGATDYDDLSDKPKLNNVTVQGNKTSTDFGLQDKIDSSHKLNADLIDDSESINKFVTAAEKTAWNKSVSYMSIPNSGDLNDYYGAENVGNYLCTDANVSTLSHKPSAITTAFRMDVIFYNDQTIQVIYPNDEKCISFLRIYKNNTWSEWKESAIEMTILSYGNSTWDEFMKAYLLNSIVYCRAGSSTPQTSPQLRLAFMAYVNDEADPTEVEFQYYRSVTNKSDSAQGDEVYVYKLNKTSGWSNLKRNAYSKIAVAAPITKSYASDTVTISHADSGVTAGTYDSVTVNSKGHVTAGSNYTIDSTPTVNSQNLVTSGGVYTDQQRQQTETNTIANLGAKNFVKTTTFTFTTSTQIEVSPITGTVVLSAQNITSDDTSASYCAIVFNYSDGTSSEMMLIDRGDNISVEKTFDKTVIGMTIYASRRESSSFDKTATFTNLMIRPATITDSTFMPYAPTNRELYEIKTEQVETNIIANLGAKNYCPKEIETSTSSGSTELMGVNIPAGTYILSFTGTLAYSGSLSLYSAYSSSSSTYVGNVNFQAQTGTQSFEFKFKVSQTAKYMRFYHSGGGNSLTNIMIRPASIVDPTFVPYSRTNAELTSALIKQVDSEAKNLVNLNTDFTTHTYRGITYTNNHDGTINVSGTSTSTDSYVTLYDRNTDNLFGIQKGETVVLRSTSDDVSINLVYKKSDGNYGLTVYGYKSTPGWFTIPSDFVGFLLRIGVPKNETTVNEDVRGMICTVADYIISSEVVPHALPNTVITPALIKQVDEGAKNIVQLGFTSTSGSSSVPATTNNNDGTITVNGSRVGAATILVQDLITAKTSSVNTRYTLPAGNYVIAPTGNANIGLQVYKHDGTNLVGLGNSRLTPLSFTYSDADKVQYPYICIRLYCEGSATINNFTFMPMVCTKAAWDVSHKSVPYAPTNRELYEMIGNINTILQGVL